LVQTKVLCCVLLVKIKLESTYKIYKVDNAMKKLLIIFFGIFVVGCATTANYEKILSSWVGAKEIDLVRAWGAPDNQYESSGTKFLTYQKTDNIYMPGTAPTYTTTMIGNTAHTTAVGGTKPYNIQTSCKTTFEINNGTVVNWRWEGNGCKAK
jgi:hypothetical protein